MPLNQQPRTFPPKYERLDSKASAAVLSQFERQTGLSVESPVSFAQISTNRRKVVRLNLASHEELWSDLQAVNGIGIRTLNKITTERALHGSFQGAADFDRRVRRVTFSKLEQACAEQQLVLSFETTAVKRHMGTRRRESYIHPSLLHEIPPHGSRDRKRFNDHIVLSSWNTGRMTTCSERYEEKVGHLFRFMADSKTDILSLQEVCEGVTEDLCDRLLEKTGVVWSSCEAYGQGDDLGTGLATLFRLDKFFELGDTRQLDTLLDVLPFKRIPEIVLLGISERGDECITLINVHLDQADPREEIGAVAAVVRKLRQVCQHDQEDEMIIVLGDFNMNSDSLAFSPLREAALVELIRPPTETRLLWHPYHTIQSATTIGNQWYDNIWISKGSRNRIKDAWCFDFGGRRQSLGQSGYQYAAQKRASCSDHLPIVAKVQI
ncbi:Endonuclease/exonuclease/phosphatase [Gracilaria domingensis]|nr:Endonuclease/exonuclease/phosphatase [Gracilaria domingensis]